MSDEDMEEYDRLMEYEDVYDEDEEEYDRFVYTELERMWRE